jgi:hypothetical protein
VWPLNFLGTMTASPVRDLLTWSKSDVPKEPGAYILLARPEISFRYPRAESPVFYIGQASNLRGRLYRHRVGIKEAKEHRKQCLYRPTREYGASFGAFYTFVLAESGCSPKSLEDLLMARFAKGYGSLPVANGAGAWERIRRLIEGEACT